MLFPEQEGVVRLILPIFKLLWGIIGLRSLGSLVRSYER